MLIIEKLENAVSVRCTTLIFIIVLTAIFCLNPVYAATSQSDFLSCRKHTKDDRENCQSGCGLILRSCYDEAIAAVNEKNNVLREQLYQGANPLCAKLAEQYINNASQLENKTVEAAQTESGWLSVEISLLFAEHQLHIINLIKSRCVGNIGN